MKFIETPIFSEDIDRELSLEEYRRLQLSLLLRPKQGDLIRGSGGLRKLRWRRRGMGKGRIANRLLLGGEVRDVLYADDVPEK